MSPSLGKSLSAVHPKATVKPSETRKMDKTDMKICYTKTMKTPKIILHSPKVSAGKTVAKRLHMYLLLFLLISACSTQTIDVLTKNPDVPSLSSLSEVTNESTGASLFVLVY